MLVLVGLILVAYLLGSISFGVLSSKLFGIADPRSFGSKNIGATNVLRSGNKSAAVFTLVMDAAKGWLGASLPWLLASFGLVSAERELAAWLCPIAVVLGHMFPVLHGFKGGKGVAPAAGAMFGLHWMLGLATVATWAVVAFFFRISSAAALASCAFVVFYGLLFFNLGAKTVSIIVIAILVIWRHHENIGRLLAGTEPRIGKK